MSKKNQRPRFEKFLPYLLFIFIGFCIADVVILAYRDLMLPTQPPPAKPQKFNNNTMVSRSNYSPITSRNIFSSDGIIPDPLVGSGQKPQEDEAPVPSSLPLALKGTIVHSNPAKSIANVEVKSKNQVIPYPVGRDIENLASVVKVERAKVIIRNANNGRLEFLEMKLEGAKLTFNTAKPAAATGGDVVQVAPNTFEIKRSDLNKYTSDMASILQQASMAPRRGANGEIECFKFLSIQPGSIYTQFGLQNGDCIFGANGEKIDSPAKAMEAYNMMKNSSNISLQIERDGRRQDNSYNIK